MRLPYARDGFTALCLPVLQCNVKETYARVQINSDRVEMMP